LAAWSERIYRLRLLCLFATPCLRSCQANTFCCEEKTAIINLVRDICAGEACSCDSCSLSSCPQGLQTATRNECVIICIAAYQQCQYSTQTCNWVYCILRLHTRSTLPAVTGRRQNQDPRIQERVMRSDHWGRRTADHAHESWGR
jgi:hypothetical protein